MDNRIENVFKIRFNDRTRFVSNRFVEFVSTNATTLKRNLIFIKKKKKKSFEFYPKQFFRQKLLRE